MKNLPWSNIHHIDKWVTNNTTQVSIADLLSWSNMPPEFKPVLYYENGRTTFLAEDTSYSTSHRAISSDFWTELYLDQEFHDPVRKAQWKAIELNEK